jgi:uncharacterized repeat protein (TIGR01451 family)
VTATSGPHTNIATTNGTYNGSTPSDSDPANYLGSAGPPGPEITVVKSVGASNAGPWNDANTSPGPTFAVGANVYFQYVITNTGGVPLTDVTLTDSVFAPLSTPPFAPFPPSPLAPGDSYTYVYGPVTSTSGLHTNVATSTGIYSESQVTDTDPANYTGVTGELTVTKTADTTVSKVGDCICFTITVTNNTGVPVTVTSVGDRLLERDGNSIDAGFTGVYAPGESRSHTYCYTVRPGDPDPLVNTVTVNGTTNTRPQVPITGQASVTVDLVHPGLVVIKRGPASAQVGDVVTYTVTFGNTGDVAMENIQVTDSLAGVFVPAPPTTLAPLTRANVTFTYTVQANDPNPLINIVTVTANPVGLPNVLTATGTATLEVTPAPNPCILVTKTASPSYVCVGDTVTYTMAVRNCGNVPLVGVTLVDSILGTITLPTTTLQPGQAAQVQVPYVVKCSDPSTLGNTATATGYAACSGRRVTSSATARVRILHPLLVVRKTANRAYANPGEAITYTVTITNFGDVAIRGIQVADNLPARFAPPFPTTLNPGASATSTFAYTVRPCDPNPLVNRVTVRGIACYTNCPVTATSSVSTPRSCYVAPPPCPPTYLCYP